MDSKRRRFSPEQKVLILREHFKNKVGVAELCRKYDINPNLFYRWEKQTFEGWVSVLAGALRRSNGKVHTTEQRLKAKIGKLEEVISWLTQENIELKKSNGEI